MFWFVPGSLLGCFHWSLMRSIYIAILQISIHWKKSASWIYKCVSTLLTHPLPLFRFQYFRKIIRIKYHRNAHKHIHDKWLNLDMRSLMYLFVWLTEFLFNRRWVSRDTVWTPTIEYRTRPSQVKIWIYYGIHYKRVSIYTSE